MSKTPDEMLRVALDRLEEADDMRAAIVRALLDGGPALIDRFVAVVPLPIPGEPPQPTRVCGTCQHFTAQDFGWGARIGICTGRMPAGDPTMPVPRPIPEVEVRADGTGFCDGHVAADGHDERRAAAMEPDAPFRIRWEHLRPDPAFARAADRHRTRRILTDPQPELASIEGAAIARVARTLFEGTGRRWTCARCDEDLGDNVTDAVADPATGLPLCASCAG